MKLEGISPGNKGFVTKRRAYKQQHRGVLGIDYHLVKLLYPVTLLYLSSMMPSRRLGQGFRYRFESIKLYVRPTGR
jgi:hypothetical protein